MHASRSAQLRRAFISAVLALCLASCATATDEPPPTADHPPIVVPPAPIAPQVWTDRGHIVSATPLTDLESTLAAVKQGASRATYFSVDATTGQQTTVSGAFFTPQGQPPRDGWPVIALAHGTTGASNGCGPSTTPDLRGDAGLVAGLLQGGYAVTVTDYEGLGSDGSHPYLEPRTAAMNLIDSVRALRGLDPAVSDRWLAYGVSQGGQASWAAAEFAAWYGDGLDLVGAVALAPAANIVGFSELAFRHQLTRAQLMIAPMVVAGLARYDSTIDASKYLRGDSLSALSSLIGCSIPDALARASLISSQDVGPTTTAEAQVLTDALRRIALPQRPASVPLLVINGLNDHLVLPQWVDAAVARSCTLGDRIQHRQIAGADHTDLKFDDTVRSWIGDRFAGKSAPTNCSEDA